MIDNPSFFSGLPGVSKVVPVVCQLGGRSSDDARTQAQLRPHSPILIGLFVEFSESTAIDRNALQAVVKSLSTSSLGLSILHENNDVPHETSHTASRTRGDSHLRVVATRGGVLACTVCTISIARAFLNAPLNMVITIRADQAQGKPFGQQIGMDRQEMDVRHLMDLNRYRPQPTRDCVMSVPVRFIQPLTVSPQIREISPNMSILSLRLRNHLSSSEIYIQNVVFHSERTLTRSLNGSQLPEGTVQGSGFSFALMNPVECADNHCVLAQSITIAPDEEFTLLYTITAPIGDSAVQVPSVEFTAPCTVFWSCVHSDPTEITGDQNYPSEDGGVLPELHTVTNRLLEESLQDSGHNVVELSCPVMWTLGSEFAAARRGPSTAAADAMAGLHVSVKGPSVAFVDQVLTLAVCIYNSGEATVEQASLSVPCSSSIKSTSSVPYMVHEVESYVGTLRPGATATATLSITPLRAGPLRIAEIALHLMGESPRSYQAQFPYVVLVQDQMSDVPL